MDTQNGRKSLGNIEGKVPLEKPPEQRKSPPAAAGGLSKSDQTGHSITGNNFCAAFRVMMQARDVVQDIVGSWAQFDREGRSESDVKDWEYAVMEKATREAEIIYRECYRLHFMMEFKSILGADYEDFEVSLNELKRIYGRAS